MGLNRYGAGGGVGSGAQPQKPEVGVRLRAILITKTVVAVFRGEKNEVQKMRQAKDCEIRRQGISLLALLRQGARRGD